MSKIVNGMTAAVKLSEQLGKREAPKPAAEEPLKAPATPFRPSQGPQEEWDSRQEVYEGPQEAPGGFGSYQNDVVVKLTVHVPLEAVWELLKGVSRGK